jgi:hypothetical protein
MENRRKAFEKKRRKLQRKSAGANIFLISHDFGGRCFAA